MEKQFTIGRIFKLKLLLNQFNKPYKDKATISRKSKAGLNKRNQ